MTATTIFEGLLGHVSYLSNGVAAAISQCFAALPQWYQPSVAETACLGVFVPNIKQILEKAPRSTLILRRFADTPPDCALRTADTDFDRLTDVEQEAVTAVLLNALVKWSAFRSLDAVSLLKPSSTGLDFGNSAFEKLFALHCHLKQSSPNVEHRHLEEICRKWIAGLNGQIATPPVPVGPLLTAALTEFDELMAVEFAIVDLDRFGNAQNEPSVQDWFSSIRTEAQSFQSETERDKVLARATIARACQFRWREPNTPPRRVVLVPPSNKTVRRVTRLLAMVHELHKAGYQQIRISPHIGGPGFWRCNITPAANIESDGFTIRSLDEAGGLMAVYSSAAESEYFGWPDAPALNARQMADRFLQTFPKIASEGAGRDWMYAGWLTDVLGRAEQGEPEDVITLYNSGGYFDAEKCRPWAPPPPPNYS